MLAFNAVAERTHRDTSAVGQAEKDFKQTQVVEELEVGGFAVRRQPPVGVNRFRANHLVECFEVRQQ